MGARMRVTLDVGVCGRVIPDVLTSKCVGVREKVCVCVCTSNTYIALNECHDPRQPGVSKSKMVCSSSNLFDISVPVRRAYAYA